MDTVSPFLTTISEPLPLPHILRTPPEILNVIASYLDPTSALSFALSNSHLLIPGETRLWSTISLGDPYTRAHFTNIFCSSSNSCSVSPLLPGRVPIPEPDRSIIEQWPRSAAVRRFFIYLLNLIHSRPYRQGLVRTIDLELGYLIPAETVDILNLVGGGLSKLSLGYPLVAAARYPTWAFVSTSRLFTSISTPLLALRHVEISIISDWDNTVLGLLNAAPNISFLKINSHHPTLIANDSTPSLDPKVPSMHKLKTLIIESMRPTFMVLLQRLIKGAKGLKQVALRAPTFLWQPEPGDPLLDELGKSQSLEKLEFTSDCLQVLSTPGYFQKLKQLAVLWKLCHVESHLREGWVIPPLPLLQRYQINVSQFSSYWSTQGSSAFLHLHAGPQDYALSTAIAQLYLFPDLTIVSAPSRDFFLSGNRPENGSGIAPNDKACDWREDGFRGLVVASYVPPPSMTTKTILSIEAKGEEGSGDSQDVRVKSGGVNTPELIHYRAKISKPDECTGLASSPCKLEWQEGGLYQGHTIPPHVITAIFSASGLNKDDFSPGRRRNVLNSAGWAVLEHWLRQKD